LSLQGFVFATFRQPASVKQLSSVHGFASLQFSVVPPPVQWPAEHWFGFVHTRLMHIPSPHDVPSFSVRCPHPNTPSHVSFVQGLSSSHGWAWPPPVHWPATQAGPEDQDRPSQLPPSHLPQSPPHPSEPQFFPVQSAVHSRQ
jgi:hypothetical protein